VLLPEFYDIFTTMHMFVYSHMYRYTGTFKRSQILHSLSNWPIRIHFFFNCNFETLQLWHYK